MGFRNYLLTVDFMFATAALLAVISALFCVVFARLNPDLWQFCSRGCLIFISLLLSSMFTCIGAIPNYFANQGCWFAMKSFHFLCSLWIDVAVEVRGIDKIAEASGSEHHPIVIISNHQSVLDLFVISSVWPSKCTAMMKKSLKYLPFFNIGAILSNSIFVDRFSKENAKHAMDEAVQTMRDKKLKVWIFPEGTRNRNHGLLPFKKGAFNVAIRAHFPIVPIVISDYRPFYSKIGHYFRSNGKVIVQIMDPISTQNLQYEDAPALCESIHAQMEKVYERISAEASTKMAPNGKTANLATMTSTKNE